VLEWKNVGLLIVAFYSILPVEIGVVAAGAVPERLADLMHISG
jgi:hypothetical protein